METKIIVETLCSIMEETSHQGLRNICWHFAINHPIEFMEAAADNGYANSDKILVEQVIALAKKDAEAGLNWNGNWNGKVPLIKAHRALTNQGLKESKDWIEAHFDFNDGTGRARIVL